MLRFVGKGDQKKFTKNPRHFSMQNSQANANKIFTNFFWRAGKITKERSFYPSQNQNSLGGTSAEQNWGGGVFTYSWSFFAYIFAYSPLIREAPDTFNFLRHVMRAIWSGRPKCSHRCVSLKGTPLKPVQIVKHTAKNSAEQTAMRTKWFKHIAI